MEEFGDLFFVQTICGAGNRRQATAALHRQINTRPKKSAEGGERTSDGSVWWESSLRGPDIHRRYVPARSGTATDRARRFRPKGRLVPCPEWR